MALVERIPARDQPVGRSVVRRGFTLIELLVVIAIISILVALIMPAVQQAREAARQIQCRSHLKQIGLALHSYHDLYRSFPFGRQSHTVHGTKIEHTWAPSILPQIDQSPLYEVYDFDVTWENPSNQPAITKVIPLFLCPSTPIGANVLDDMGGGLFAGRCDYAPPMRVADAPIQSGVIPEPANVWGALQNNLNVRMAEIVDGTSNTVQMTEDAGRPEFWTSGGPGPTVSHPGGGNASITDGRVQGAGWANRINPIPLHTFRRDGLKAPGDCAINCSNNNEAFCFHPSGVNALFADGRVRFLNEYIDIKVYAALITRAGDELISGDSY